MGYEIVFKGEARTYAFGVILMIIVVVTFTTLLFQAINYWAFIAGPIVALLAARPGQADGPWLWETKDREIKGDEGDQEND